MLQPLSRRQLSHALDGAISLLENVTHAILTKFAIGDQFQMLK